MPTKKAVKKAQKTVKKSDQATSSGLNGSSARTNKLKRSSVKRVAKPALKPPKLARPKSAKPKSAKPKLPAPAPAPAPAAQLREKKAHEDKVIEELMITVHQEDNAEILKEGSVGSALATFGDNGVQVCPDEETE